MFALPSRVLDRGPSGAAHDLNYCRLGVARAFRKDAYDLPRREGKGGRLE